MNIHIFERAIKKASNVCVAGRAKAAMILPCVLCVMVLSGCSGSSVSDFLLRQSGAVTEEELWQYSELRDKGQLDEDGHYISAELNGATEPSPPAGSVHVTFAENAYIKVQYFLDAERQVPIDTQKCYLQLGDCIYTSVPECHHPTSSCYSFDRFCVYPYDADGTKSEEPLEQSGEPTVLQIPEDYNGTELSVVPMGKYEKLSLELTDYYTDSAGRAQELDGTWTVNDKETADRVVEVSSVESLVIDYQYDSAKYCYVSSNPSSFYHENGLVRFELVNVAADIERYSVELRSLVSETFLFDPSRYPVEHGSVIFEYSGRTITEPAYIPDGGVIQYTAMPDSGYHHPKSRGQITVNVSNSDETNGKISEAVKFYSAGNVEVILPRPDGGTIEYTTNGKVLTGNRCTVSSGTVITMNFTNWNGWINNVMDGAEYTVTEQKSNQTVTLDGVDINHDVFTESPRHKPTLNIVLTDSAKDVQFDLSAAGAGLQENLSYAGGNKTTVIPDWLGQNARIIFSGQVGTYPSMKLIPKNDTIFEGYALRLDILMKDTRGNESHEIRYIEKLPVEESIEIYSKNEIAESSVIYETVNITVSKEEVVPYNSKSVEHANVTATLTDVTAPYILKDGDVLEPSRNVVITITPDSGYYVSGSKDADGVYCETLKFSKWEKDYQKILDKHPVKKIWHVTLDTADSYGTCTYKLDGEEVSGPISVREGQKLTLEYQLADSDYQIVRSGVGGFVGGLTHDQSESRSIPISEALDGKTIQRSDYIQVERKG